MHAGSGRRASELSSLLKESIWRGEFGPGEFLPTVRELSKKHGLACSTVHRALKNLAKSGLIAPEPRQGFRVRAGSNDPLRGCPFAYVFDLQREYLPKSSYRELLRSAFDNAARRRGWPLLSLSAKADNREELKQRLRHERVCGLALDMTDPALIGSFQEVPLPAVLVNSWREDVQVDVIVQDGQQGGLQAADYLARRGHRRIAWFGVTDYTGHRMDRFSGALMGLMRAGLSFLPDMVYSITNETAEERARAMLMRPDRPTAVIALWQHCTQVVARVAAKLGLTIGRDLEMVGWSTEEEYADSYAAAFPRGEPPPTIVWSVNTMAEAALDRVYARHVNPALPLLRIKVPARLRLPGGRRTSYCPAHG